MVKILIVTHGPLAGALKESAKLFCGEAEHIETVELNPEESPETLNEKIKEKIRSAGRGGSVMILVDLFAGTTSNMSALAIDEMKDEYSLECFSGVNLPMMLEILTNCETCTLEELKADLLESAHDTILDVRAKLNI